MKRATLFMTIALLVGCTVNVNQPKVTSTVDTKVNAKAEVAVGQPSSAAPVQTQAVADCISSETGKPFLCGSAPPSPTPDPTVARVMYDACGNQHIYSGTFEPPSPFPSSGMETCYASFGPVPPEVKATPAPTPGPSYLPTPTPLPQPSHVSQQPDGSIVANGGGN